MARLNLLPMTTLYLSRLPFTAHDLVRLFPGSAGWRKRVTPGVSGEEAGNGKVADRADESRGCSGAEPGEGQ